MRTHECTLRVRSIPMTTIKVGVREFRERIASFLESDTPVAVTRRGETLGVYVPTRHKHPNTPDLSELKAVRGSTEFRKIVCFGVDAECWKVNAVGMVSSSYGDGSIGL